MTTTTKRGMVPTKAPDVWSAIWAKRGARVVANHDVSGVARAATAKAFGAEVIPREPWWKS
jgi:hypothetical protein